MQVDDYAEADCREVSPPIEVGSPTWSAGGTLDWWVKKRREWLGRVRGPAINDGSELLIFAVLRRCDRLTSGNG
jgi:hypothetical protein